MKELPLSYFFKRPSYWLGLIGFGFAWLAAQLPLVIQSGLAQALGKLMLSFSGKSKKIVAINLKLCFPNKSEQEIQQIIKDNALLTGVGVFESVSCWFRQLRRRKNHSQVKGGEHLEAALAKNKGVILLSYHTTGLEIGGMLLSKYFPVSAMYKPSKNLLLEAITRRGRLQHMQQLIKQSDLRSMLKALKNNQIIWYAADQDYGASKTTVFAPFFNVPASTITATSKFAKLSGAAVVPYILKRINGGKDYLLEIQPALENFPEDDLADIAQMNAPLEKYLSENPADYFWVHPRFKTRPKGEASFYPKKKPKKK